VILLAGLAIIAPRCGHFIAVDRCLDNGGVWDDAHDRCVHQRS
jgi:hypothetical protein